MMKKKRAVQILTAAVSFAICAVFLVVLLAYVRPMKDGTYDFSLTWEGEAIPTDWVYDQKGWSVFTQDENTVTELSPDGYGGFTGLGHGGQTFYFSRTMAEDLDSPTIRLGAVSANVAVFLNGRMIYTDCPEQDNEIGRLSLPTPERERLEPVMVSLPLDYVGKTLTVAQSTSPGGSEKQNGDVTVYPCSVMLTCGYAYESGLIAESFQTAIPSVIFFLAGAFLLAVFVRSSFRDKTDIGLACAAAASFLWVSARMVQTSFAKNYFGILPVDVILLARFLSLTALLAFLSSRMTGRRRLIGWLLTGVQAVTVLAGVGMELTKNVSVEFQRGTYLSSLVILLAALLLSFGEWRKDSGFFRLFCSLTAAGIAVCALAFGIAVLTDHPFAAEVRVQLGLGAASYFLQPLMLLMMATVLIAAITQVIHGVISRRTEARLLAQRQELAQASYETMRSYQEQVMMLRHDMAKHFALLRQMTGEARVSDYLDELLAQNEKIRPVVQSGNEILDIILNGKLTAAADAGINIKVARTQAPATLPLSDAELCSVIVNIMDNAVAAASAPGVERPYIKLDMHIKSDFFVFSCINSATREWISKTEGTEQEGHGLGLKIIRQISQRHGDLLEIESGSNDYKVMLALPLPHSSK